MRKIIAMLFVMALCMPVFAEERHKIVSATYTEALTIAYATATASACELAYIIVESTTPVAARIVTVRDNTTAKFVINVPAGATTSKRIDLSNSPVRFATNLNYGIDIVDGSVSLTLVYKKLN